MRAEIGLDLGANWDFSWAFRGALVWIGSGLFKYLIHMCFPPRSIMREFLPERGAGPAPTGLDCQSCRGRSVRELVHMTTEGRPEWFLRGVAAIDPARRGAPFSAGQGTL